MVCDYLLTFLCVVIASASAHIHTTVDMAGPFISKQSASSFITPTRGFEETETCYNLDDEMICPLDNYQRQTVYTREFYLEEPVFHNVDTLVKTTDDEYTTKTNRYQKKEKPMRRHGRIKPTGLLWHKQSRYAPPPPPPPCSSSPCANSAGCTDTGSSYTCSCTSGWTGANCNADVNECNSSPCQNGGTCYNGRDKYTCSCVPGWTGTNCQTDIDECLSQPCLNGATCNNLLNHYTCTCAEDFIGTNCETDSCELTEQKGADVVFVVDSSASLSRPLFEKLQEYLKTFVSNFPIGLNDYQVAIVSYASSPTIHCHLNTHSTEADLHAAVDQLQFEDGASYTGSALRLVREEVLTSANGKRENFISYVIVLTDGMSSDITDTKSQANELKWNGATLFSVAFGPHIYHPELLDIASDSRKVFPSSMQDPVFTILKNQLDQCPDCFRNTSDVIIVLDASSDLSPTQFYPTIDALVTLIEALPIGPDNVHISYTKYAKTVHDEFDFNQYQTTGDVVKSIVNNLKQYTGPANLTRALDHVISNSFTEKRGRRPDARKFAVVFTQGNFEDFDSVQTSAETLKNSGITLVIVAIGVEVNTNLTSLIGLASDPALAFIIGESIRIPDTVLRSFSSTVEFDICEFD